MNIQQTEYATKLREMDDVKLRAECEQYIWLSAYAYNNPRSAYHWMCDATYDECARRGKGTIYSDAHAKVSRQCR